MAAAKCGLRRLATNTVTVDERPDLQARGDGIDDVAGLFDRRHHALARFGLHFVRRTQGARHGDRRNPRFARDIFHADGAPRAPLLAVIVQTLTPKIWAER